MTAAEKVFLETDDPVLNGGAHARNVLAAVGLDPVDRLTLLRFARAIDAALWGEFPLSQAEHDLGRRLRNRHKRHRRRVAEQHRQANT